jgi:hypothetical protein
VPYFHILKTEKKESRSAEKRRLGKRKEEHILIVNKLYDNPGEI